MKLLKYDTLLLLRKPLKKRKKEILKLFSGVSIDVLKHFNLVLWATCKIL